jgi:hypothetical protein
LHTFTQAASAWSASTSTTISSWTASTGNVPEVALGVDLRDIGGGMAEGDLGGFQAEAFADLRGVGVP